MANIITNIPLTYREPDGDLISPIKGKPTEVSEAVASDLKNAGLAEDYSGGGSVSKRITVFEKQNITTAKIGASAPAPFANIVLEYIPDSMTVTIDGYTYTVEKKADTDGSYYYGADFNVSIHFLDYPFRITVTNKYTRIYTENQGEHTLEAYQDISTSMGVCVVTVNNRSTEVAPITMFYVTTASSTTRPPMSKSMYGKQFVFATENVPVGKSMYLVPCKDFAIAMVEDDSRWTLSGAVSADETRKVLFYITGDCHLEYGE